MQDIDVSQILSGKQGKTVRQSPGTYSAWFKQKSGTETWEFHTVSPGGTQSNGNFLALVSNPQLGTAYRACYGTTPIKDTNGNDAIIHFEDEGSPTVRKPKCGMP